MYKMQKMVYLSNSRDYTEQGDVNENKYFARLNEMLEHGWKVSHITPNTVAIDNANDPSRKESFSALILLEKDDNNKWNYEKIPNENVHWEFLVLAVRLLRNFFGHDITHHLKNRPRQNRGRFFAKEKSLVCRLARSQLVYAPVFCICQSPRFYIPPISAKTIKN